MDKFKEALNNIDPLKRKSILQFLKEYKTSPTPSYRDLLKNVVSILNKNESIIIIGMALYIKEEDKENFLLECVKIGILGKGISE
ncbi:Hypothetical protein SRAE_1000201000 [Strongyloides ratti]|uniref:Uncharacterized protein n=1 Tax=Strongyloides ratti TaxID=34506 RepID=A0A090L253_STRRB|nr:Hypothetical protein SRAE_1000201000 [Strongyloides ratti]CEF63752.1 Hypothetical protein SRAE_1000201000 [Strongyloides ratti]